MLHPSSASHTHITALTEAVVRYLELRLYTTAVVIQMWSCTTT